MNMPANECAFVFTLLWLATIGLPDLWTGRPMGACAVAVWRRCADLLAFNWLIVKNRDDYNQTKPQISGLTQKSRFRSRRIII
jgi:hypothetical protein